MRRRTKWLIAAAVVLALPVAEVSCRALRAPPPPPPPPPVAPPAKSVEEMSFAELIASLRIDAEAGKDRDLAPHADLLAAIATHALGATAEVRAESAADIAAPLKAKREDKRVWATIATCFEPGADPDRTARVWRTYERYAEWTGKDQGRVFARDGEDVELAVEAKFLWFGPRWHFRAHPIARGKARINVCAQVPSPDTESMVEWRGLFVAFPEPGGTRVVEANVSVLDVWIPALLEGPLKRSSLTDLRERMESLRHRWRDLPAR